MRYKRVRGTKHGQEKKTGTLSLGLTPHGLKLVQALAIATRFTKKLVNNRQQIGHTNYNNLFPHKI